MYLGNLRDFHAEIVRIFSKKYLKDLQGDSFDFCSIIFSENTPYCCEYLFKDISLLIILAK